MDKQNFVLCKPPPVRGLPTLLQIAVALVLLEAQKTYFGRRRRRRQMSGACLPLAGSNGIILSMQANYSRIKQGSCGLERRGLERQEHSVTAAFGLMKYYYILHYLRFLQIEATATSLGYAEFGYSATTALGLMTCYHMLHCPRFLRFGAPWNGATTTPPGYAKIVRLHCDNSSRLNDILSYIVLPQGSCGLERRKLERQQHRRVKRRVRQQFWQNS